MQYRLRQLVVLAFCYALLNLLTQCTTEQGAGKEWHATFDKVSELLDARWDRRDTTVPLYYQSG